jgi:hypothetical protein
MSSQTAKTQPQPQKEKQNVRAQAVKVQAQAKVVQPDKNVVVPQYSLTNFSGEDKNE